MTIPTSSPLSTNTSLPDSSDPSPPGGWPAQATAVDAYIDEEPTFGPSKFNWDELFADPFVHEDRTEPPSPAILSAYTIATATALPWFWRVMMLLAVSLYRHHNLPLRATSTFLEIVRLIFVAAGRLDTDSNVPTTIEVPVFDELAERPMCRACSCYYGIDTDLSMPCDFCGGKLTSNTKFTF